MKRTTLLSTTCLALIAALGMAEVVHAETPSGIASSIGVVTGQPPVIASPVIGSPVAPVPSMPNMPAMPKMPEIPTVKIIPPSDVMQHPPSSGALHQGHGIKNSIGKVDPSTIAFNEANATMHQNMAIQFSGNTDIDFVKGMIPHHQGAVDMAKVVLQFGKDPEIKKFAENIIKAQASEIEFMNKWLANHPK